MPRSCHLYSARTKDQPERGFKGAASARYFNRSKAPLSVGTWNPSEQVVELSAPVLDELTTAANKPVESEFELSSADIERLAGAAHANRVDWRTAAENLSSEQLVALTRFYTLAEGRFPAWKAGSNSPVIVLAKVLRARDAWPAGLTAWIKAHTDNRFLPYGSLMDRL